MKINVFKGSMIILMVLLFLVSVTAVSSADNNTDVSILTLSKGGITIQYPSDWGDSQATSNYSVMAISKTPVPKSVLLIKELITALV